MGALAIGNGDARVCGAEIDSAKQFSHYGPSPCQAERGAPAAANAI
jgi:hypothetical protein